MKLSMDGQAPRIEVELSFHFRLVSLVLEFSFSKFGMSACTVSITIRIFVELLISDVHYTEATV